jgi:hypothetical protein
MKQKQYFILLKDIDYYKPYCSVHTETLLDICPINCNDLTMADKNIYDEACL